MSCSLQLSPFDFSFCFSFFLLLLFQFACGHKTSVILSGLLWPAQTLLISLHALLESTHHSSSAEALFWKIPSCCILSLFLFSTLLPLFQQRGSRGDADLVRCWCHLRPNPQFNWFMNQNCSNIPWKKIIEESLNWICELFCKSATTFSVEMHETGSRFGSSTKLVERRRLSFV